MTTVIWPLGTGNQVELNQTEHDWLQGLYRQLREGEISARECANQARVLLDFKTLLPGCHMLPERDPAPALVPPRTGAGRYSGPDPTLTEAISGDEIEADRDAGPIRPGGAMHTVLTAYGEGGRMTSYDASFAVSGDWHSKRRESTRLMERGFLAKNGTLPNKAPAGREHVDAYVITFAGRQELQRLTSV